MKHMQSYFCICIKKAVRCYRTVLITTIFLGGVLILVGSMLLHMQNNDESRTKVKIGITGDIDDLYLGIGFSALEDLDDIGISVEFMEMTEAEAEQALENMNIHAYISVPENFISDLVHGKDTQFSFVMIRSTVSISGALMADVVKIVSPLVAESERGIYSLIDYGNAAKAPNLSDTILELNLQYIEMILNRAGAIDLKTVGVQSLTLTEYYICGIAVFFLLLFSISCCVLFSDKQTALGRLLCSKNMKVWELVLCEYAAYTILVLTTLLLLTTIGSCLISFLTPKFGIGWFFKIFLMMIPCVLMITAMQYFIYEATEGFIAGILAQFMAAASMGYLAGCFYPYYFFPKALQTFASFLPSGLAFGRLRHCVAEQSDWTWLACILYFAVFFSLSIWIRHRRLRRNFT